MVGSALFICSCAPPVDDAEKQNIHRPQLPADFSTAGQLADLKAAIEQPGTVADDRLAKAMTLRENDALARELVRSARQLYDAGDHDVALDNLLYFLSCRSGTRELLIDGPYLKEHAELLFTIADQELVKARGWGLKSASIHEPLLLYLCAHAEDTDLRERTVALAKKYAKVADLPPRPQDRSLDDGSWAHRAWNQVRFAWTALLRLGVLNDGFDIAEAKEILGEPTETRTIGGIIHCWIVPTEFRILTLLQADEREGKLEFHFGG